MIHSSSETANSPTPISPFSTYSGGSEVTSDEAPDLGAFNSVFREFQQLQTGPPRILHTNVPADFEYEAGSASSRSGPLSALPTDSEANAGSTVWHQGIVQSYFDPSVASAQTQSTLDDRSRATDSTTDHEHEHSFDDESYDDSFGPDDSESETEGELEPLTLTIGSLESDGLVDTEQPNLGTIDSVIEFLVAERDRAQAGRRVERRVVHYSSTSDGGARRSQDGDARRAKKKRKRKRPLKTIQILRREGDAPETVSETTVLAEDASGDADRDDVGAPEVAGNSSSSLDDSHVHNRSTPSTPPRGKRIPLKRDVLKHSKSTPTLHVKTIPPDPQILKLRCLAHKLRLRFSEDYERITALLTQDFSGGESDFSDPRGPAPRARDTLIHVFIDQLRIISVDLSLLGRGVLIRLVVLHDPPCSSNILIGLLTYHKKHRSLSRRPKRLSHAALALLLERGRPITRRCLVTSSPLYQPMDSAIQLGYDVRIYARVPDNGDGPDRRPHSHNHTPDSAAARNANWRKSDAASTSYSKGHVRGYSSGNISTDSDRNGVVAGSSSRPISGPSGSSSSRVRYREQGVDELLQLKLHQAIAASDPAPANATIVLATGDGNVGQFNEEGFLGPVRLALQRGWKIELYAWEEGLSRTWRREFSTGPYKDRFRIIKMEDFAEDLLEVDTEGK
ncbi:hypothetical protein HYDPIDRAFT_168113 [Hydnomerulius pinastri MD-312]|uniref:NYN domain-containing protein n=1 Tax=Hydnomerulius pinastri MD-312 TaxID=994086 RepID=A0A0C9WF89_9AGAM|nr:hypothetical protein HYDPIDRAFT_168113 [Hydnomerulius pinastri MD-312]